MIYYLVVTMILVVYFCGALVVSGFVDGFIKAKKLGRWWTGVVVWLIAMLWPVLAVLTFIGGLYGVGLSMGYDRGSKNN